LTIPVAHGAVDDHFADPAPAPRATPAILLDAHRPLPNQERTLYVLVPRIFLHIVVFEAANRAGDIKGTGQELLTKWKVQHSGLLEWQGIFVISRPAISRIDLQPSSCDASRAACLLAYSNCHPAAQLAAPQRSKPPGKGPGPGAAWDGTAGGGALCLLTRVQPPRFLEHQSSPPTGQLPC